MSDDSVSPRFPRHDSRGSPPGQHRNSRIDGEPPLLGCSIFETVLSKNVIEAKYIKHPPFGGPDGAREGTLSTNFRQLALRDEIRDGSIVSQIRTRRASLYLPLTHLVLGGRMRERPAMQKPQIRDWPGCAVPPRPCVHTPNGGILSVPSIRQDRFPIERWGGLRRD